MLTFILEVFKLNELVIKLVKSFIGPVFNVKTKFTSLVITVFNLSGWFFFSWKSKIVFLAN